MFISSQKALQRKTTHINDNVKFFRQYQIRTRINGITIIAGDLKERAK